MSRKRLREDDDFDYGAVGNIDIDEDAVSVDLSSEIDPTSSPVNVTPTSSPAHGVIDDDESQTVCFDRSSPGETSEQDPTDPLDLSIRSFCVEELDESVEETQNYTEGNTAEQSNDEKERPPQFSYDSDDSEVEVDDGISCGDSEDSLFSSEEELDYFSCIGRVRKENIPIYKDAPITVDESMLLVLTYAVRHNICGAAIVDLLKLLSLHCKEEENEMKTSLYFFKKHFSHLKAPVKLHYFCSDCYEPLLNSKSQCKHAKVHSNKTKCSFFLEISLEDQIQTHFKRKGFVENMQHRFTRVKIDPNNIEDIYDSQLYKEQVESGFLSEKNKFNFSLTWNTDGVPVFTSGRTSMWPVFFVFNELPFKMRFKKDNILLGGIWYGSKPCHNLIMYPFVASLKKVRKGIEVQPYGSNEKVVARGTALGATADLPAKADLLGIKHTGGSHACTICKIEGKSVLADDAAAPATDAPSTAPPDETEDDPDDPTETDGNKGSEPKKKEKKKTVWVFPYSNKLELRQHKETEIFAVQALEIKKKKKVKGEKDDVYGVKWPTYVSKIMPDMIRGFGIDDLHHTYHGVFHKLLELWTLPQYRKQPWSIHSKLALVDSRVNNVSLPNFVQCGVRSITNLSLWKGLHYKIFMLYLALPILQGILPNVYLDHFACFVNCIFILNSSSISPSDLLDCAEALDSFVREFEELYGQRHCTMNVHNTLHLAYVCNNLGPMRCYSCFPFESLNGEILRMIHGTRFVQIQLANCAYYVISLQHEIQTCGSSMVKEFASKLHHSYQKIKLLEAITPNSFAAGNYLQGGKVSNNVKLFLQSQGINTESCVFFTKFKKGSILFVAQCYTRATKTLSCCVSYLKGTTKCYGFVVLFVGSSCQGQCKDSCNCKRMYHAVIQPVYLTKFSSIGTYSKKVNHIFRYKLKDEMELLDIDQLLHISIAFNIPGGDSFLCERVNWLEIE